MQSDNNPKLLKAMTYLCYGCTAIALLLSFNGYFEIFDFAKYIDIDNLFLAFLVQLFAISTLYMLIFFMILPHIKTRKILAQIFSTKCQILPIIPLFFIASGQHHIAYLTLLFVHAAFFITNEVGLQNKYYPNGNYYIYKILVTIGFVSTALIIQKTEAILAVFG